MFRHFLSLRFKLRRALRAARHLLAVNDDGLYTSAVYGVSAEVTGNHDVISSLSLIAASISAIALKNGYAC